jgi:hypothetical protein
MFPEENKTDIILGDHITDEYPILDVIYNNSNSPNNPSSYFIYEKQTSEKNEISSQLTAYTIQETFYKEDNEIIHSKYI